MGVIRPRCTPSGLIITKVVCAGAGGAGAALVSPTSMSMLACTAVAASGGGERRRAEAVPWHMPLPLEPALPRIAARLAMP